jgi:carbon-monoxide dehydrogenase iron sulfur subunit
MRIIKMTRIYFNSEKCLGCHSCEFACAVEHSKSKDPVRAHLEKDVPVPRRNVNLVESINLTMACCHCEIPLCVEACITGAMQKQENGRVICDLKKCTGCWMCVMVCPFGAIKPKGIYAIKCDMCPDRDNSYACIEACPTKALYELKPDDLKKVS